MPVFPRPRLHDLPELIERDLGEYSGMYLKDRSDYFSLSAGEDAGGMEPFSDVLNRMYLALKKLDETGFSTLAAVSHGAAINVLLAGLSHRRMGTGKTKLYNGGISILEGNTPGTDFRLPPATCVRKSFPDKKTRCPWVCTVLNNYKYI